VRAEQHATERDVVVAEGLVVSIGRGDLHHVAIEMGGAKRTIIAKRSGHLAMHRIAIVVGDRVRCELSPYDLARGRITYRL
jgi:translation initiation factor IF-1